MDATDTRGLNPRTSLVPAILAFLLGLGIHLIDRALFVRAGPIPILLTAPVVTTLVYLRFRDATRRRILTLLVWGPSGRESASWGFISVSSIISSRGR